MTHILVAYATKNGSTQEVAEYIGTVLQEDGADLELCPAKWVRERIEGYDLVMLGAPLYSGRWHRDADFGDPRRFRPNLWTVAFVPHLLGPLIRTGGE